jgi:hypothetical protein
MGRRRSAVPMLANSPNDDNAARTRSACSRPAPLQQLKAVSARGGRAHGAPPQQSPSRRASPRCTWSWMLPACALLRRRRRLTRRRRQRRHAAPPCGARPAGPARRAWQVGRATAL